MVEIIIPSAGNADFLRKCVTSIKNKVNRNDLSITVVLDNHKNEEEVLKLKEELGFSVVNYEGETSFSRICNTGISQSKADQVILLNDDTEALNDFVTIMVDSAKYNEGVGVVGAKLLYPNGKIQFAGHIRNPFAPKWFDHLYRNQERNFAPANKAKEAISVTGACMLITSDVLDAINTKYSHYGLDPMFGMGFEDVDFCFKARRCGYKIWYEPKAELTHYEGGTRGIGEEAIKDPRQVKSIERFWANWTEGDVDELSKAAYGL